MRCNQFLINLKINAEFRFEKLQIGRNIYNFCNWLFKYQNYFIPPKRYRCKNSIPISIFPLTFCSTNDDLWKKYFPQDNPQPDPIQNQENPSFDSSNDKFFINYCIFWSHSSPPVNIRQNSNYNTIKILITNSKFQNNYNYNDISSSAANIFITYNVNYVEYKVNVLNCGSKYQGQHFKLYNENESSQISSQMHESVYSNLGIQAEYANAGDWGTDSAKFSLFCLISSYKEAVLGFNFNYCNIFNNTAGDCQYGIISFYWQPNYQIYIDNCVIFNNGCEMNTLGTNAGRINIYVTNSFIDNCKVGGSASISTSNVTNSYYEYDLPLFQVEMCNIYSSRPKYRMKNGNFLVVTSMEFGFLWSKTNKGFDNNLYYQYN